MKKSTSKTLWKLLSLASAVCVLSLNAGGALANEKKTLKYTHKQFCGQHTCAQKEGCYKNKDGNYAFIDKPTPRSTPEKMCECTNFKRGSDELKCYE